MLKQQNKRPLSFVADHIRSDVQQRVAEELDASGKWIQVDISADVNQAGQLITKGALLVSELSQLKQFEDQSINGIFIHLQLAWFDFQEAMIQVWRILRPGGQLLFSTLGPDSLNQIQRAWAECDNTVHVHEFTDMHHLGDALMKMNFEKPILDVDWLVLPIKTPNHFFKELKYSGCNNALVDRRKTLTGKTRYRDFERAFEKILQEQGQQAITLEVIYGYACKSLNGSDGRVLVRAPTYNDT